MIDIYKNLSTNKRIRGISKSTEDLLRCYTVSYEAVAADISRMSFLRWLSEKELSPASKATVASILAKYYHVMGLISEEDRRIIVSSFRAPIPSWGNKTLPDSLISDAVMLSGIATSELTAKRDALSVVLLATFGLRIGQLLSLNVSDLYAKNNDIYINVLLQKQRETTIENKYSIKRVGKLHKAVQSIEHPLHHYIDQYTSIRQHMDIDTDALLVSRRGKRISIRYMEKLVNGIGDGLGHKLTPHSFRHHLASKIARTKGILSAAILLNHNDISTTQRYINPEEIDIKEVLS